MKYDFIAPAQLRSVLQGLIRSLKHARITRHTIPYNTAFSCALVLNCYTEIGCVHEVGRVTKHLSVPRKVLSMP